MDIIKIIYTQHKSAFWQMLLFTLLSGLLGIGTLSSINYFLLRDNQLNHNGILIFVILIGVYFVVASLSQIQLARLGQQFIYTTQTQLVKRIMDSQDNQLKQLGNAKLLASLSNDIRSLSIAFTRLPELVQGLLLSAVCSLYLIYLSPKLFLITAILMVVMIAGTHFVVKKHYASFRQMRDADDAIQQHYETVLNGHKELKLNRFRAERFYNERLIPQAQLRRDSHIHADAYHALAVNWGNCVMLLAVGCIFYLSLQFQWASLSDAATITMTVLFMRAPLMAAIGALPAMMQSQVGLQALQNLGLSPYESGFHSDFRLPENWQTIRLENVSYTYPAQAGEVFSIKNINLTIKRGEILFLIGGNGSGKSTLSMVLSGLYAPTSGQIFIDEIPITDKNRAAYRQLFSSVFTDFHLFEQLMDGTGADVSEALIEKWIDHLQLSQKVKIEQKQILNQKLSQGQRKRLALLIAALEQRSLMILDEWAADQDPQFRRLFYEQLLPLLQQSGHTVFAISHDDKYFHHAERIVSMKQGVLSELDTEIAKQIAHEHSQYSGSLVSQPTEFKHGKHH